MEEYQDLMEATLAEMTADEPADVFEPHLVDSPLGEAQLAWYVAYKT